MGITVHFDWAFDREVWPGPLRDGCRARAGELWLGPLGLLARLEVELGLGAQHKNDDERAVALAAKLVEVEGFWSESAKVDAVGCARRILWERETLALGGWDSTPSGAYSERLQSVAKVTRDAPPGPSDRLRAVIRCLQDAHAQLDSRELGSRELGSTQFGSTQIETVHLYAPRTSLPRLWRDVLTALEGTGTTFHLHEPETRSTEVRLSTAEAQPASNASDLAQSKSPTFAPSGDGSLVLFRPIGVLAAAEAVAAWLATLDENERAQTVVVGADNTLDQALAAHGLPTTAGEGAGEAMYASAALEVLPLCLRLAVEPQDPTLAHALLTLPHSPVPKGLARRLVDALDREPSLKSDSWKAAREEGLAKIEDPVRRARTAQRLEALLAGSGNKDGEVFPTSEAKRRSETVRAWAQARAAQHTGVDNGIDEGFHKVVVQTSTFEALLELHGRPAISQPDLAQLCALASSYGSAGRFVRQAGLAAVHTPAAIVAPVKNVVWWDFGRHTVRQTRRLMLSKQERDALTARGVELPDPAKDAAVQASGWRRAHRAASERLVLVAPERASDGERFFVHPFWDELVGAAVGPSEKLEQRALLPRGATDSRIVARERALPVASEFFSISPNVAKLRQEHSPSALSKLLGCTLQYALHYQAKLRENLVTPPEAKGPLQAGRIAHKVFERVFANTTLPTPDSAYALAEQAFDEELERLATAYVMAGSESERGELRLAVAESAKVLASLLDNVAMSHSENACSNTSNEGALVLHSEKEVFAKTNVGTIRGRPDLVIEVDGSTRAVLDFKYGRRSARREELETGTAVQLASYAAAKSTAHPPALSYLIVRDRVVLSNDDRQLPGAALAHGPDATQVWRATERTFERRASELAQGSVHAPANGETFDARQPNRVLGDGSLHMVPACKYCDFSALCGKGLGERERTRPAPEATP